jgi:hypothetical protein
MVNDEEIISEEDIQAEKKKRAAEQIKKTMDEYYGKGKIEPEIEIEPVEDLPTFTLDDLEDDTKRGDIENIPAWKRMK